MNDFFSRKKIINTITINMLYMLSGISPAIVFRIINDRDFLEQLRELLAKFESKHRRKS
jgi:hypothetical protein